MQQGLEPALVVMARAPAPGAVKTRLQPHLTARQCASLYLALLRDAVELAASACGYRPFLAFTPADAGPHFEGIVPQGMARFPQLEGDLGRRMHGIAARCAAAGHPATVIMGSDLPALQPETLARALEILRDNDLCFGPASDGGYYLVGMKEPLPAVFYDIPWSTQRALAVTLERAREAGLSVALVDECADVDTFDDLARLGRDIARLRAKPGARVPRHTARWLTLLQ